MNSKIHSILQKFEALTYHIENDDHSEEKLLRKEFKKHPELERMTLSLTECHMIAYIGSSGGANNTMLSKELNITKGGISKAASKLVDKKMVIIEKLPNNKKEIYYSLTELGNKVCELHDFMHQKAQDEFLNLLLKYDVKELEAIEKFLSDYDKHIAK